MAIAYFIPDQTKLLASSSAHSNHNNASSDAGDVGGGGGGITNTNAPSTPQQHPQTAHDPSGSHNTTHHHSNNNFRANITIPLSAYSATAAHSDVGCWDLLTQIFCHALRFCHQTERHPAVIQISLEISSSASLGGTTVQVGAQAAPVQQQQQQGPQHQSSHAASIAPRLDVHSTAVPQNAATQAQQQIATAAGVARPSVSEETSATAAALNSRNLEPGTHKPPTKRN